MTVMWSVISALFILAICGMAFILGRMGIAFNTGQWIGYLSWLIWTLFGIALVCTFINEGEHRAARIGTLIFGGTSIILAAVIGLIWIFP